MKKYAFIFVLMFVVAFGLVAQTTADEWYEKACEYYDSGDYANAITAFSESIRLYRTNQAALNAYWLRGAAYYAIKNNNSAIADFDIVINGAPDFAAAYMFRGDSYGRNGIYLKAVTDYRTGLEKGFDPSEFGVDKSNNSDMWFCGAIYMGIVESRFLGNASAVTRYENWLTAICNKDNLTRAEVETFYRNAIRQEVTAVVNREFYSISFDMGNTALNATYDATLSKDVQTGYYTLSYYRRSVANSNREITAPTFNALLDEMRRRTTEFDQTSIAAVQENEPQMPGLVYADRKARGEADALALITDALVNFYTNSTVDGHNTLLGINARYALNGGYTSGFASGRAMTAYGHVLLAIFPDMGEQIDSITINSYMRDPSALQTYSRYLTDTRYEVFGRGR